ncbi:MAG: phosphatidylglycerol lysyltransferase domain-containing protein [Desulfobacterales bacterium]|jgi:hypothetical protein
MDYTSVSLDGIENYRQRLAQTSQVTSDYSFVNIWSWAGAYNLKWSDDGELIWLRQTDPETIFWAPVGNWEAVDWQNRLSGFDSGSRFSRVPEKLVDLWQSAVPERLKIEEARNHWDYVYRVEELAALRGNRFHKKKNLLNQFKKRYAYKFVPFSGKLIEEATALQDDWCTWRDCESDDILSSENHAIQKVLDAWSRLPGLLGGAILVDGFIVAYTVGEPLDDTTLVIHFEKGCTAHKGVYQAINQMFLESVQEMFTFVNREQDLGDEGLRKAKLSYNPSHFMKKFNVTLV